MKLRSIFAAAAVTLVTISAVFAQNVKEMAKVIPRDSVLVVYGNANKLFSTQFMQGLITMAKNNPAVKEACPDLEAEIKNSDGEILLGASIKTDKKNSKDVKVVAAGLVRSKELGPQWKSNIERLKKDKDLTCKEGKLDGKDYVTVQNSDRGSAGYALKLDDKTAYVNIVYGVEAKKDVTPAMPVSNDKLKPFVEKIDAAACLSIACDVEACTDNMTPEEKAMILPGLEHTKILVLSFSEKGPLLQLTARIYADEKALSDIQMSLDAILKESKRENSPFGPFLNGAKVEKKADHVTLTLSLPSQFVLGMIEMSLLDAGEEEAAAPAAPAEKDAAPAKK